MATVIENSWNIKNLFNTNIMTTTLMPSPLRRAKSPDIAVTSPYDDGPSSSQGPSRDQRNQSTLAPPTLIRPDTSDGERSDRYFTASSGDDYYDDDDDDDGLCIRLDSDTDGDNQSLSGFHINLKTLQEVSSMLARYNPIIQSDIYGNPSFIAPPPPPEEEYHKYQDPSANEQDTTSSSQRPSTKDRLTSSESRNSTITGDEDFDNALQELDQALLDQDRTLFSDAMTELTDVMEKMTNFMGEKSDDRH